MSKTKLYQKFLAVQQQLKPLTKSGRNEFHRYTYTTASDVLEPTREACNAQGLIIFADVTDSKTEPGRAWVNVCLTIADAETGESISINAAGYAEDWSHKENHPTGDKQLAKAITAATKYAFRTLFCLPSEDDPEKPNRNDFEQNRSTRSVSANASRGKGQISRSEWLARQKTK